MSLENIKPSPQHPQQPTAHVVHISQVITETTFLERSAQLQATLAAGSFTDFCQEKIDAAQNEFDKTVWSFLKVGWELGNFSLSSRVKTVVVSCCTAKYCCAFTLPMLNCVLR